MLALAVLGEYWPSVVFVRVKILQRALGWSGVIFCIHLSNFGSLPIPPTSSQGRFVSYNYSALNFTWFLDKLTTIVDDCLKHDVVSTIS